MSENTPTVQATPDSNGPAQFQFHIGAKTPKFKEGRGQRPSPFSASDLNVLNRILDALCNAKVKREAALNPDGSTATISEGFQLTEQDFTLILSGDASGGGTGSGISGYELIAEYANYIVCQDSTGHDVNILKPPYLTDLDWSGPDALVYDWPDGTHTYARLSINSRTDTVGSDEVIEIIWPPYTGGEIIYATAPSNLSYSVSVAGVMITLVDLNLTARRWLQIAEACNGSQNLIIDQSFPYTPP